MRSIKSASQLEYIFLFSACRTQYLDLMVQNALDSGQLWILYEDNAAAGLLCAEKNEKECIITYVFTKPEYRRRGVMKALLTHQCNSASTTIRTYFSQNHVFYSGIKALLLSLGFRYQTGCRVYHCEAEGYTRWNAYLEKTGNRLLAVLARQGYTSTSFRDMPWSVWEELWHSGESAFDNQLPVKALLSRSRRKINPDLSFVTTRKGELAAYCMVSCLSERTAIFEQTSSAKSLLGSGVILQSFANAMCALGKKADLLRVVYTIYETNQQADAFRKKILRTITSSENRIDYFIYNT